MEWVDLGQPCPLCVLVSRHYHSRRADGTVGVVVKLLQSEKEK